MRSLIAKLSKFMKLNFKRKLLLLEAFLFLARARYLKLLPFEKVAPTLGKQSLETTIAASQNDRLIKDISSAIETVSKHTFWESACLVQAFAVIRMLNRRQIETTLYMGIARDENGKMIAHAWVRSGPLYVTGAEMMNKFTVVRTFANGPNLLR